MTDNHPITPPPPHLLRKFSAQAQEETKKRNGAGYLKTFATLCIEWAMNSQSTSNDCQIRSSEIEPPTELVDQWVALWQDRETPIPYTMWFTQAAQWGADQELEACCAWLRKDLDAYELVALRAVYLDHNLRATRRPMPSSLKEQALAVITNSAICDHLRPQDEAILRRALEALDD